MNTLNAPQRYSDDAADAIRESYVTEVLAGAGLPHDARLEPRDETIAEVQALVVQSRQLRDLSAVELCVAMSDLLATIARDPGAAPAHAIGLAALALRLREEHTR